jgi:hypothetical protein
MMIRDGGGEALKNTLLYASVAAFLGSMLVCGQEKTAVPALAQVSLASQVSPAQAWTFSPADVKVIGTLNDGQTSKPAAYSTTPKYQAFVFEGNGHDQVEITVTGANRKAYVALADSGLKPIASGIGQLAATLPYRGPDTEAFYILVKNLTSQPARLEVHLKKIASSTQTQPVPDATH